MTMARRALPPMQMAFEDTGLRITIADIQPLTLVTTEFRKTLKYRQIEASILAVGIVEPPVVAREGSRPGKHLPLDGHLRIENSEGYGPR